MELRSHQVTLYLGALALVAACSSSNVNSNPFEQATQNKNLAAAPGPTVDSGGTSSSGASGSSSGDTKGAAAGCSSDGDCNGGCAGSTPCCCDTSSMTCFSPESGACPGSGGGSDGSASGDDGSSTGDDSGGMQMMP